MGQDATAESARDVDGVSSIQIQALADIAISMVLFMKDDRESRRDTIVGDAGHRLRGGVVQGSGSYVSICISSWALEGAISQHSRLVQASLILRQGRRLGRKS